MENNKLSMARGMSRNLQFVRFVAASLVIMSHSFVLSTGNFEKEWFYKYSNGQITMGAFAVGIFFLYSGFLTAKSLQKNPTMKEYVVGRCVRIFPLLIITVLLSMFVLGPIMTEYSIKEYFFDSRLYKYFLNSCFILQHDLPKVFSNNIYDSTINGALWTLPVEFLCYIICYIALKINLLKPKKILITFPLVVGGSVVICIVSRLLDVEILTTVLFPVLCFYVGVVYYVFREYIVMNVGFFLVSFFMFLVMSYIGYLKLGFILFFCYCLIYFAFGCRDLFKHIWKCGNWSYAMYLCGFPVQQALVDLYGGKMNSYVNIIISFPIIIFMSIGLYYLIEKRVTNFYKEKGRA